MKTKIFTFICAIILGICNLLASDTQVDGIYYDFNNTTLTATVIYRGSYSFTYDNEYSGAVVIPESVTYNDTVYSVTSIGSNAFEDCFSLTSITIPNSVTRIRWYAFADCSSLTSITIPNSVTSIEDNVFNGCSSLTSITIPNSVTSIGEKAFTDCSKLASINCKAAIPPILGSYVFRRLSTSIPVYVPCGSVSLYKEAYGWESFSKIQESLPEYSLTISSNDEKMGSVNVDYNTLCGAQISANPKLCCTFVGWSDGNTDNPRTLVLKQDTTLTAEFAITTYSGQCGDNLYWEYDTITKSITITGSGDMYNYTSTNQPWPLFQEHINEVTISNSATSIGMYAFYGCSSLTSITIPNSVTSIGEKAFMNCSSLTSITIPNSVTSIGDMAFMDCSSLTFIVVETNNAKYDSRDNCNAIIETATNTLIVGCKNTIIPNSVTSIGSRSFIYCSSLTSITIPNSVTSIEMYAFYGCASLTSVTIGDSVTSIGKEAFSGCSSLTSVMIGNSVTSIGNMAFYDCESLASITIPNSVTSIGSGAFQACKLTHVTSKSLIPPSIGYMGFTSDPICYIPCGTFDAYHNSAWIEYCQLAEQSFIYEVSVDSNNDALGIAKVFSHPDDCISAVITAIPNEGYTFVKWSDGNTQATRYLELTDNVSLTAYFAKEEYTIHVYQDCNTTIE